MDLDLGNDDYFLCSWNGTEITQIHTKESLIEEYKQTGLAEDDKWYLSLHQKRKDPIGTVTELMDFLIEEVWLFKPYHNCNMTIMYIKTKE